ncbi:MAG: hypothetical protein ACRC35_13245 [Angustibacter sp.]
MAGDDPGADQSMSGLLRQALGDNPAMAPVLSALQRREQAEQLAQDSAQEPVQDSAQESGQDSGAEPDEHASSVSNPQVADVLHRLHDEVRRLRRQVHALAAALGACARCWGQDQGCPRCAGRGRSGARAPDPVLYHDLVSPAVRRRTAQERSLTPDVGRPSRPDDAPPGTSWRTAHHAGATIDADKEQWSA